ncbi:hypothetical protein [Enterobacter sp. 22466]|uniref:hypothetical protein n=1 Tax=Enterobacter sp. 22466 TaxID=3453924 RepID=UPI003F8640F9
MSVCTGGRLSYQHWLNGYIRHWVYAYSKTLNGLQKGKQYQFAIQAARIIGKYKEPRLSLRVNSQDITPVTVLSEAGKWVTIEGGFTPDTDAATFSVLSHESDSMGNDYQIKELKIYG